METYDQHKAWVAAHVERLKPLCPDLTETELADAIGRRWATQEVGDRGHAEWRHGLEVVMCSLNGGAARNQYASIINGDTVETHRQIAKKNADADRTRAYDRALRDARCLIKCKRNSPRAKQLGARLRQWRDDWGKGDSSQIGDFVAYALREYAPAER